MLNFTIVGLIYVAFEVLLVLGLNVQYGLAGHPEPVLHRPVRRGRLHHRHHQRTAARAAWEWRLPHRRLQPALVSRHPGWPGRRLPGRCDHRLVDPRAAAAGKLPDGWHSGHRGGPAPGGVRGPEPVQRPARAAPGAVPGQQQPLARPGPVAIPGHRRGADDSQLRAVRDAAPVSLRAHAPRCQGRRCSHPGIRLLGLLAEDEGLHIRRDLAALAGSLTILYVGGFAPAGWSVYEIVFALACLFVGGVGNNYGGLVGAALVVLILNQASTLIPTLQSNPTLVTSIRSGFIGVMLILILRFRPQGIIPERTQQLEPEPRRGLLGIKAPQPKARSEVSSSSSGIG